MDSNFCKIIILILVLSVVGILVFITKKNIKIELQKTEMPNLEQESSLPETDITLLKKRLEEKYRLEQEMVRLCGGETGLVQLRERMKQMEQLNNLNGIELFQQMYKEKAEKLTKSYCQYELLISQTQEEYKMVKESVLDYEEKEFYRLLLLNNEQKLFYKSLIEEYPHVLK